MHQFPWIQFENRLVRALMHASDRVHIVLIPEVSTECMTQYLHYAVSDTAIVCELRLSPQTRNVSSTSPVISALWSIKGGSKVMKMKFTRAISRCQRIARHMRHSRHSRSTSCVTYSRSVNQLH